MLEYKRKYSIVHLTNEGLFHEGQLPGDYDGPVLDVEVAHRILFINGTTGELTTISFNSPAAKTSGRSIAPYPVSGVKLRVALVNENVIDGDNYLPKDAVALADVYIAALEADGVSKVI